MGVKKMDDSPSSSLVFDFEPSLQKWFKKNKSLFGYWHVLKEWVPWGEPFPDFWCIREEDRRAERVEIELLSYNFFLHGHDIEQVDVVYYAEDNSAYYGLDRLSPKFKAFPLELGMKVGMLSSTGLRYRAKADLMLSTGSIKMLVPALVWFQHPVSRSRPQPCTICNVPLAVDSGGRIKLHQHLDCVPLLKERLKQSLKREV